MNVEPIKSPGVVKRKVSFNDILLALSPIQVFSLQVVTVFLAGSGVIGVGILLMVYPMPTFLGIVGGGIVYVGALLAYTYRKVRDRE